MQRLSRICRSLKRKTGQKFNVVGGHGRYVVYRYDSLLQSYDRVAVCGTLAECEGFLLRFFR